MKEEREQVYRKLKMKIGSLSDIGKFENMREEFAQGGGPWCEGVEMWEMEGYGINQ